MITLKIKLKSRKRHVTAMLENKRQVDDFVSKLYDDNNFVHFGQIIFNKCDFLHATYTIKE